MIFKSLILQGFKSFPDKTQIDFNGGLTAIVGPNGSGKSNISDAIRWALGEQSSRSLRGAKMEDVIFGGTAKRGPVGFAEVSLILDNASHIFHSDFTEIMVTRRYYRSGESEYYLNKKHCRLKDIHELFMDTGLGRDGYSSIGQGRIDEILSLKSEDRREIFEEAAGITKLRYRKEESERRLAATEDNLTRIRDIFDELSRQLAPLEKQSEKARQYLVLRDELRVLEVSLWLHTLSQNEQAEKKLEQDRQICQRQLADCQSEQQAQYAAAEQLTEQLHTLDRQAEGQRGDLREQEQKKADATARLAVLRADIQNNEQNIVRTREQATQNRGQAEKLAAQLSDRQAHIEQLSQQAQTLAEKLQNLQNQALQDDGEIEQSLSKATAELEQLQQQLYRINLQRAGAAAGLDGMAQRHQNIEAETANAEKRLSDEQDEHTRLMSSEAECRDTLAGSDNKLQGISLKAEGRRKKVEQLTDALAADTAALTDAQNRVRMLSDMQRDFEGFSRAVKSVMGAVQRGKLTGVHAPVSSLISVDERFVTAIDTALGAQASSIVVDTAQHGKRCIAYLKQSDGGRATFLPLDTIRPSQLREQGLDTHEGCFGTADLLVTCDTRYRAIVQNLLARTVVCTDMDAALSLAKAYQNRFRIVTLDGQIIQAGGAMTGGSASRGSGALARAAALSKAEQQVSGLTEKRNMSEAALKDARQELAALDYDLKAIEGERSRAQEQLAALSASINQHSALLDSLSAALDGLQLEQRDLDSAGQSYRDTIAECEAAQKAAEEQLRLAEQAQLEAQQAEVQRRQQKESRQIEQAQLQSQLAQVEGTLQSENRAAQELSALAATMQAGLSDTEQTILEFEAQIEQQKQALVLENTQIEQTEAAAEQIRRALDALLLEREQTEQQRRQTEKQAQSMSETLLSLEREASRLSAKQEQLTTENTQILDKMWENYELTPSPAAEVARPVEQPQQMKNEVSDLRSKMRALGNVNLDAIEQYAEAAARHGFLQTQKDDLETAQRELYKMIEDMTTHMKEIFASEFAKLNHYFGQTFREIFGGGHAELQLADTSDILSCGIDIRVSPPGKAVKTITLLSGGEKAFVAIALYFAILKLRPTPFCVLDEIEAALDDVNVVRYAKYIRGLTENTQFICITHRRGTMEEADMLYGVTMQEQGVSRLLMLNLAEAEQHLGKAIQ